MKSKWLPLFLGAVALVLVPLARAQEYTPKPGYKVELEMHVNEDGTVEDARVISSDHQSGDSLLQRAAMGAALRMKLPVRQKDGKPVKYTAQAPVYFPVEGDEGAEANKAPQPRVHHHEQIVYPPALAEKGVVGGAIVEMIIGANGNVSSARVMRASHPEFATAAAEGLKRWIFVPAMKDGQPVESRWRIAITFATDQQDADWMWRVAPRPSLGNYTVAHRMTPLSTVPPAGTTTTPAPEKK